MKEETPLKKLFQWFDKAIGGAVTYVSAVLVFAIFAIVTILVFARYVFHTSAGGIDELPTYFLLITVWLGAVLCSRDPNEGQIKVDVLNSLLKKKPMALDCVNVVVQIISIAAMLFFAYLSFQYVGYGIASGNTTLALRVPIWIFTLCMSICSCLLAIYEAAILVRIIRRIRRRDYG